MIMGMWSILEEGRDDYGRGFGMRDGGEIEEAYRDRKSTRLNSSHT